MELAASPTGGDVSFPSARLISASQIVTADTPTTLRGSTINRRPAPGGAPPVVDHGGGRDTFRDDLGHPYRTGPGESVPKRVKAPAA